MYPKVGQTTELARGFSSKQRAKLMRDQKAESDEIRMPQRENSKPRRSKKANNSTAFSPFPQTSTHIDVLQFECVQLYPNSTAHVALHPSPSASLPSSQSSSDVTIPSLHSVVQVSGLKELPPLQVYPHAS